MNEFPELCHRPALLAELKSNKKFNRIFVHNFQAIQEIPKHLYRCAYCTMVLQLIYHKALAAIKPFEQELLKEDRVTAYNNAVSALKEAITNARKRTKKLRLEYNKGKIYENPNLPD